MVATFTEMIWTLLSLTAAVEEWIDIPGFNGNYKVSSLGKIKTIARKDRFNRYRVETILKPSLAGAGYKRVHLSKDGVLFDFYVHRLVADAFIPNPNKYPQVNHKNGVKTDNRADNLEWCTQSHNVTHAYQTGLHVSKNKSKGEDHHCAKLTKKDVLKIREIGASANKPTNPQIGKMFNIKACTVQGILTRRSWKHIQ